MICKPCCSVPWEYAAVPLTCCTEIAWTKAAKNNLCELYGTGGEAVMKNLDDHPELVALWAWIRKYSSRTAHSRPLIFIGHFYTNFSRYLHMIFENTMVKVMWGTATLTGVCVCSLPRPSAGGCQNRSSPFDTNPNRLTRLFLATGAFNPIVRRWSIHSGAIYSSVFIIKSI